MDEELGPELEAILAKTDEQIQFEELHRLYNYADDDSRQFTRWQMVVAMEHGFNNRKEHLDTLCKAQATALTTIQDREATLIRENEAFERALRVQIWNRCKNQGMRDELAYKKINATIEGIKTEALGTSGLVERSADNSRRPSAPNPA